MRIEVCATPEEFDVAGSHGAVVVIDVFRASTTITAALAGGCRVVLPAADVEQAMKLNEPYRRGEALLGGERDCRKIEGFDLGNSPREYAHETVAGKVLVFTSTNGVRALLVARGAEEVYVGCFLNFTALSLALAGREDVTILCAGNEGRLSLEDFICAGGYAFRLAKRGSTLNDAALAARAAYSRVKDNLNRLLHSTEHARRLVGLGFRADLEFALKVDSIPVVPRFGDGRITIDLDATPAPGEVPA